LSIAALTSPVNGPAHSELHVSPPIAILPVASLAARSTRVAGKQSKTSAGGREALTVLAIVSISHRWVAKPFIFQFPAISGLIFA
jgi:hypothetical protein